MAIIDTSSMGMSNILQTDKHLRSLTETFEKLSSGLKINQAKDNPALLAIADQFTTQIKGVNQARLNANDGIAIAQVAGAGLSDIQSGLQRLQELAVQSASGTLNDQDRSAIHQEAQGIQAEIAAVVADTNYNDIKLLASSQPLVLQTGANSNDQTAINLKDFRNVLSTVDLSTQSGAQSAIAALKNDAELVSAAQADFAAVNSSMESSVSSLFNYAESLFGAGAKITNGDVAQQASSRLALSIRAQSSLALQIQANHSASVVQQLLS